MLEPLDTVSARTPVAVIEFEYEDDAAAERADELVVVTVWRC